MYSRNASVCVGLFLLLGASITTYGQAASPPPADSGQAPATPAPAPAPAPAPTWSIGPIDFSGLIDGYYSANLNSPSTRTNQLYNFDVQSQQFSLNMAKLRLSHTPDPMGFQVDFGFGKAFTLVHAGER